LYFTNENLTGLESRFSPYSKSHNRRLKRKAKEQLSGGLDEMRVALENLDSESHHVQPTEVSSEQAIERPRNSLANATQSNPKPSLMIGEGKSATLTKAQRKRAL